MSISNRPKFKKVLKCFLFFEPRLVRSPPARTFLVRVVQTRVVNSSTGAENRAHVFVANSIHCFSTTVERLKYLKHELFRARRRRFNVFTAKTSRRPPRVFSTITTISSGSPVIFLGDGRRRRILTTSSNNHMRTRHLSGAAPGTCFWEGVARFLSNLKK